MADSSRADTPMHSDSSGEEFVPNSASGSDTESDEYAAATATSTKAKSKNQQELQNVDKNKIGNACEHGCKKRSNSHLESCVSKDKRCKMQRNTTHASKINCCDVAVVKACLCSAQECCGQKCLQKLAKFGDDAVSVLSELRHRRFAGTLRGEEKITIS